ncbi:hypothetical protein QJS10_CPB19g00574 [Acorus calamus]|uniref:50S ribosomal protein L22, chloroplastic n=1 Tax=Acorus calamus TaxID=4465 RepID=A0AAV9CHH8_ACOCL|nr:hypothetical protein QJS10_CPB19g00574 [Acorus calamus]
MAGWQRHLRSVLRQVEATRKQICASHVHSYSSLARSNPLSGQVFSSAMAVNASCKTIRGPLHQYLQRLGISSSRNMLSKSDDLVPVSSPLTPVFPSDGGKTEGQTVVSKPSKVQAILKKIRQKITMRRMKIQGGEKGFLPLDPTTIMSLGVKFQETWQPESQADLSIMRVKQRIQIRLWVATLSNQSPTLGGQVIHSARANATHNHGLDPDRLIVDEAFVGKGVFLKRISYHAKMRHGIMERPHCRLTVVLREITPEEEAKIAKLRVCNYIKMTKKEKRLVPHRLIEVTPRWGHKRRTNNAAPDAAVA